MTELYNASQNVQEKSEEKYSAPSRLKKLRLVNQWNWKRVAKELGLSESMVYAIIAGRRPLGDKAEFKLNQAEREAGVILQVEAAAALNQKRGGGAREMGMLYSEIKDAGTRTHQVDVWKLPSPVLENMFSSIGEALKDAEGEKRTELLQMLNLVHDELQSREKIGKAYLDGKELSDDEREIALGSRAVAEHMARQRGVQESQRSDKAASTSGSKSPPGGGVRKGKEGESGDR